MTASAEQILIALLVKTGVLTLTNEDLKRTEFLTYDVEYLESGGIRVFVSAAYEPLPDEHAKVIREKFGPTGWHTVEDPLYQFSTAKVIDCNCPDGEPHVDDCPGWKMYMERNSPDAND